MNADGRLKRGGVSPFIAVSTVVHVLAVALVLVWLWWMHEDGEKKPEVTEPETVEEKKDFEVALKSVAPQKPEPKPESEKKPKPKPKKKPQKKPEKEPKQQDKPQKKTPPKEVQALNRKTVEQTTNEETPEDARFLSDEANKVDEQTVARETTNKNVEPTDQQGQAADKAGKPKPEKGKAGATKPKAPKKVAARVDTPARPDRPDPRPPPPTEPRERPDNKEPKPTPERPKESKDAPGPSPSEAEEPIKERAKVPRRTRPDEPLPMPTVSDYDEVFDATEDRRKAAEHREQGAGHAMYERIEESRGSVKAALENYVTEIKPGNHTAVNAQASAAASFISQIHREIHPLWGGQYLPRLDARYGPGHPLSNPNLLTVLELVIDGETGKMKAVNIVESSGQTQYDMEAIRVTKMAAPHPKPPPEIVGADGNAILFWRFWRNQRQCGTFGVSIYKKRPEAGGEKKSER